MAPIIQFCFENAWDALMFGCKSWRFNGLHVPFCVGQAWDEVRQGQMRSADFGMKDERKFPQSREGAKVRDEGQKIRD